MQQDPERSHPVPAWLPLRAVEATKELVWHPYILGSLVAPCLLESRLPAANHQGLSLSQALTCTIYLQVWTLLFLQELTSLIRHFLREVCSNRCQSLRHLVFFLSLMPCWGSNSEPPECWAGALPQSLSQSPGTSQLVTGYQLPYG